MQGLVFGSKLEQGNMSNNPFYRLYLVLLYMLLPSIGEVQTVVGQEKIKEYSYRDSLDRSLVNYDCGPRKYRAVCEAHMKYVVDDETILDKYISEGQLEIVPDKSRRARDCAIRRYTSGHLVYESYAFANSIKTQYKGKDYSLSSIDALSNFPIDYMSLSYEEDKEARQEIMTMTVEEDIILEPSERFANPLILKAGSKIRFTVFLSSSKEIIFSGN